MGKVRFEITMSLDGYVAGPNQSEEHPLGEGGMQLHEWIFGLAAWREPHGREGGGVTASSPLVEESRAGVGAGIMGRGMFGGGPGPWGEDPWQGWWGDDPPFGVPIFVVTHHEREPLTLGDTTFTFVTDGIESALAQAREAAGGEDMTIGGGASVGRQYLSAGLVDQLQLNVVPVLLGDGERLFEHGAGAGAELEQVLVVEGEGVTHLRYALRHTG
jgi:dihydrofolate reductase